MDTDFTGANRGNGGGRKLARKRVRQNPIETAELPQKDTKNSKAFGRNIYGRKI
jgi:hypothetical protein